MNITCPSFTVEEFEKRTAEIGLQMLRVNGLTVGNAILAGILVGIANYGIRYRYRAFVGALFQGANILFLPILSYVASKAPTITWTTFLQSETIYIDSDCDAFDHLFLVLIWAGLLHIIGINTCATVAASKREGQIIGFPMSMLVQAIWSTYLMVSLLSPFETNIHITYLLPITFALIFTKIALRYCEFQKAQRSFAFGRNPPLIVGYMKQLQEGSKYQYGGIPAPTIEHYCPPPLIIKGEDKDEVEKGAHGFFFKRMCHNQDASLTSSSSLVTMDKVWQLDDMVLTSAPWLKKVCLSFTLFKLLRCRFAGYTVAEAGFKQIRGFFLHVLLKEKDHERVHGVITDELSFLHDYYYSSIPIHYSNFWLPIVNISVSLLTISDCLLLAGMYVGDFVALHSGGQYLFQVYCHLHCGRNHDPIPFDSMEAHLGNLVYDVVPVAILLVLVVLAEAREIASYICSNWTKVALFSSCVVNNHDAWQRSPFMQKWIGCVLRCRCNVLMTQWDDKMYQCSVLVMHPRRVDPVISLVMRLLRLPDRKKNVKVPGVLKARIFNALTSNNGLLIDPKTFLCRILEEDDDSGSCSSSSNDFLWACESEGISDLLLTWHIATSILEMRQAQGQEQQGQGEGQQDDMIVATHLSRYCAYLVAYVPELLPDEDEWCRSLYKAVKKDCTQASAPTAEANTGYTKLLTLLQEPEPELERKHHVVLKNGVKLGKQLVQLQQGKVAAWRFLAGFWSQMILYIAPSDNLKGHADAIARGGELITMVWALLMNVGIANRPSSTEASPVTVEHV